MSCAYLVQVLQGQDDFGDVDAHFVLGEFLSLEQVREELAAADVICRKSGEKNKKKKNATVRYNDSMISLTLEPQSLW